MNLFSFMMVADQLIGELLEMTNLTKYDAALIGVRLLAI